MPLAAARAGVRRAPFLPRQLTGLSLWLDAGQIAGAADASPVPTWQDRSGNGKDAGQVTVAKQPIYRSTTLTSPAGRPGVQFDGVSSFMSVPAFTEGVFTTFTVVTNSTVTTFVEQSVNGNTNPGAFHASDNSSVVNRAGGNSGKVYYNNAALTGLHLYGFSFDGTNAGHQLYVDSVASVVTSNVSAVDPGTTIVTDTLYIAARAGTSLFMAGVFYEHIRYNRALTAAERAQVTSYLKAKHGTP